LAAAYVASLYTIRRYEQRPEWIAANKPAEHADTGASLTAAGNPPRSLRGLVLRFVVAALGVLIAGSLVARTGEAIALQSGLGSSFVGATLVAVSTSLPEVSTTFKAVRLGAYGMAVSNILGTNAVSVALLLVGDIAYRGGPILDALDRPALFLAALGVVTTAIYLWGLLERRDKTVLGMGVDSAAVLACYLAGIVVLYFIR
jgi:cation:H+ antiporter